MIADDEARELRRLRAAVPHVTAAATFLVLARVLLPSDVAFTVGSHARAIGLPRLADVVIGAYADAVADLRGESP